MHEYFKPCLLFELHFILNRLKQEKHGLFLPPEHVMYQVWYNMKMYTIHVNLIALQFEKHECY